MANHSTPSPSASSSRLRGALWAVQLVLAALFGAAGFAKLTMPIDALAQQMSYVPVVGAATTRFIGAAELLGAIGLVLPAATRIAPRLTALAATGLATVMVLAVGYHLTHAEPQVVPINLLLGSLAAFVAWGRFRAAPIAPRSDRRAHGVEVGTASPTL
jgi:hypothetical protein